MVVWMANDDDSGQDPFTTDVNVPGLLTHGHLPENDNHGGPPRRHRALRRPHEAAVADGAQRLRHRHQQLRVRIRRHEHRHVGADHQAGSVDHVQQPRRAHAQRHLAHDHRLRGSRATAAPGSRTRSPTARSSSTRESSATADRPPPDARRGRRRPICRPGRTRTTAGFTRSCGVRSESFPTEHSGPTACGARSSSSSALIVARRARRGRAASRGTCSATGPRASRS